MDQTRKTLTEAVLAPTVSPEAYALIKQGTPKPQTAPIAVAALESPQPAALPKAPRQENQISKPKTQKERGVEIVSLVPITLRVPTDIAEALLKAAYERKLKKIKPCTQQDIATEALQEWLQTWGFMAK